MLRGVATVHALSREIDDRIGGFKFSCPLAEIFAIPRNHAPALVRRRATENDNLVTLLVKRAGEQRTDITRSTWNYDFHFLSLRQFQIPQFGNQFLNMFKKKDGGFFGRVQTVGDTGDGGLINSHIAWTDA